MLNFSRFRFDPEHCVLYESDEPVSLTVNQAKILALLLSAPEKVFSKDEILDHVWDSRAVSEQAVFQNISQLRSLLGSNAIKTFPKKGYQWQLTIDTVEEVSAAPQVAKKTIKKPVIVSLMICLMILSLVWINDTVNESTVALSTAEVTNAGERLEVRFVPFKTKSHYKDTVIDEINVRINERYARIDQIEDSESLVQSFINSPYIFRKDRGLTGSELLLSGFLYERHGEQRDKLLLEYIVQGEFRRWTGYLQADNHDELSQQLSDVIAMLSTSEYFALQSDAFVTSELSLLHGKAEQDLDVLKHLIERHLAEDNLQVAGALIDLLLELSQSQEHAVYEAYTHWLKGRLLQSLNQSQQALSELELASDLMKQTNFRALESEITKSFVDVVLAQKNFELIKQYLYQAASQARLADRPLLEIRAYTLLSINAAKLGYQQEKYDYLYMAKKLLADYKVDDSHYMLVIYHFALFAETDDKRQKFYIELLQKPVTPANYWVFMSASEQLSEMYCEQERWQDALALTDKVEEPARQSFLRAKIYHAKGDFSNAREQAHLSFNSARTQRIDWIGLDMALILLELADPTEDASDNAIYRRFIENNIKEWWAETHRDRLNKVGVNIDPYSDNTDV